MLLGPGTGVVLLGVGVYVANVSMVKVLAVEKEMRTFDELGGSFVDAGLVDGGEDGVEDGLGVGVTIGVRVDLALVLISLVGTAVVFFVDEDLGGGAMGVGAEPSSQRPLMQVIMYVWRGAREFAGACVDWSG